MFAPDSQPHAGSILMAMLVAHLPPLLDTDPVLLHVVWMVVGGVVGLIPLAVGLIIKLAKRRTVPLYVGIGGFAACAAGGLALGICAAVPIAIVFLVVIWITAVVPPSDATRSTRRRRPRRRYEDEIDDRKQSPRSRHRGEDDIGEDDDADYVKD